MYINIRSLCYTPEANIILHANCNLQWKKGKEKKLRVSSFGLPWGLAWVTPRLLEPFSPSAGLCQSLKMQRWTKGNTYYWGLTALTPPLTSPSFLFFIFIFSPLPSPPFHFPFLLIGFSTALSPSLSALLAEGDSLQLNGEEKIQEGKWRGFRNSTENDRNPAPVDNKRLPLAARLSVQLCGREVAEEKKSHLKGWTPEEPSTAHEAGRES